jgi:hypothetical protein
MKRKTKKIVLALVVIGVVAAGGAAFTAANTLPTHAVGYGQTVVTGAEATDIHHFLAADGMHITSTTMTLTGNLADAPIVTAGFGADGVALQSCVVSAETGAFGDPDRTATATCTYSGAGYVTGDETRFNVAVTGATPAHA